MDGLFELAIVPLRDDAGAMTFVGALYEFDRGVYVLVSEPKLGRPADGTVVFAFSTRSGTDFDFNVKPLPAP
jgi:hypothetical protein